MKINSGASKAVDHLQLATTVSLNDSDMDQKTRQQLYAMIKLNLLNMSDQDLQEIAKIISSPFESSMFEKYEELRREIGDIRKTAGEWIKDVPAIYEVGIKGNGYKVMIIENNLVLKVQLISAFRKAGFVTLYESEYGESLGRIMDLKPDIAVVACDLPDIDGFSACYILHSLFNIPVILVGEESSDVNWDRVMLSGADHYNYKPHHWRVLPLIAKAILRRYKNTIDYNSKK